jgi:hypothetical protein
LNKPNPVKRKSPTERQSVTVKRRKKDGNIEFQDIVDDLPENWESVFIEDESLP